MYITYLRNLNTDLSAIFLTMLSDINKKAQVAIKPLEQDVTQCGCHLCHLFASWKIERKRCHFYRRI